MHITHASAPPSSAGKPAVPVPATPMLPPTATLPPLGMGCPATPASAGRLPPSPDPAPRPALGLDPALPPDPARGSISSPKSPPVLLPQPTIAVAETSQLKIATRQHRRRKAVPSTTGRTHTTIGFGL